MSDDLSSRIPAQRGAPTAERCCRCGHGSDAHDHFRAGTDCSACGCARFRPGGLAEHLAAALHRRR